MILWSRKRPPLPPNKWSWEACPCSTPFCFTLIWECSIPAVLLRGSSRKCHCCSLWAARTTVETTLSPKVASKQWKQKWSTTAHSPPDSRPSWPYWDIQEGFYNWVRTCWALSYLTPSLYKDMINRTLYSWRKAYSNCCNSIPLWRQNLKKILIPFSLLLTTGNSRVMKTLNLPLWRL